MSLNKRNPIWPYLLVLGCLFALSIAAPRGWQHNGSENRSDELAQEPTTFQTPAPTVPEVVQPTATNDDSRAPATEPAPSAAELTATAPRPEEAADPVGDAWHAPGDAELKVKPDHPVTLQRRLTPPAGDWQFATDLGADNDPTSGNNPSAVQEPAATPMPIAEQTQSAAPAESSAASGAVASDSPPEPKNSTTDPAIEQPLPPIGLPVKPELNPSAGVEKPSDATQPAGEPSAPESAPAPEVTPPKPADAEPIRLPPAPPEITPDGAGSVEPPPVSPPLPPSPPAPPLGAAWPAAENLMQRLDALAAHEVCRDWIAEVKAKLDALNCLLPEDTNRAAEIFKELRQLIAAGESLAPRLPNYAAAAQLHSTQYALVRRLDVWDQVLVVRRNEQYDATPNTLDFLAQLERYESTGLESDAARLSQLRDELKSSTDQQRRDLARRFDIHYRNANVRVAIAAGLLNRLAPDQQPTSEPVNETILGSTVNGNSTASTALSVKLIPDPQQWQFNLVVSGTVDSQTQTTHGPVTFAHQNQATYDVHKHVTVDPSGLHIERATASVDTAGTLVGMRTNYDSVPLLRTIVRNSAISQHDANLAEANRETEMRVAEKAMQRVDEQADPRIAKAEENLNHSLIEPLRRLSLDPTAMAMATTETRLQLRSRLAGSDQLGANTARPEAPADSLASMQLHESAINNLLERLELAGRTFTLPELHRWLADKLGRKDATPPDDLPDGVEITFAQYNPVRVHVEGARLELVLSIAEIHQGKHHWREFEVRAPYRPTTDGLKAAFVRDGAIELGGLSTGKPEVALRGIFSKVLSRERKLEVIPDRIANDARLAGLQVTQLTAEDGWIAVAIGPQRATAKKAVDAVKR